MRSLAAPATGHVYEGRCEGARRWFPLHGQPDCSGALLGGFRATNAWLDTSCIRFAAISVVQANCWQRVFIMYLVLGLRPCHGELLSRVVVTIYMYRGRVCNFFRDQIVCL